MQKPVKRFLSGITAAMLAFSCFIAKPVQSSYAADPDYKSWSQTDSRWGSKTLGSGYATVSRYGCLATSIAILAVYSGAVTSDSFNPGTFVDSMNDLGGFTYSGSLASWDLISTAVPGLECTGKYVVPSSTTESQYIAKLQEFSSDGYYMICFVGNHWVLVDHIDGNTVYMCDPGSSSTNMLAAYPFSSYTHDTVRLFKCTNSQTQYQVSPDNSIYKITASALNLRENPSVGSPSVTLIPCGEEVTVTETTDTGWGKTSYDGEEGWISMKYAEYIMSVVTTEAPETNNDEVSATTVTSAEYSVVSETADITSSNNSDVLCTIPKNSVVTVKDIKDGFAEILFGDSFALISLNDIAPVPDNDFMPEKGDVNCDGTVDKLDISMLNECILAQENLPDKISAFTYKGKYAADCNDDGVVDNDDVIQLLIRSLCG